MIQMLAKCIFVSLPDNNTLYFLVCKVGHHLQVPLSIAMWQHKANFQPQPPTNNKVPLYFLVCKVGPHHLYSYMIGDLNFQASLSLFQLIVNPA